MFFTSCPPTSLCIPASPMAGQHKKQRKPRFWAPFNTIKILSETQTTMPRLLMSLLQAESQLLQPFSIKRSSFLWWYSQFSSRPTSTDPPPSCAAAPGLNALPHMGPHKGTVKRYNQPQHPASHPSFAAAQDLVGLPNCKSTLLAHYHIIFCPRGPSSPSPHGEKLIERSPICIHLEFPWPRCGVLHLTLLHCSHRPTSQVWEAFGWHPNPPACWRKKKHTNHHSYKVGWVLN